MKHYALRAAAAALILAGCEDQESADAGTPPVSPPTDSAVGPVIVGPVSDTGVGGPEAGAIGGAAGGLTGGGTGGVPFDGGAAAGGGTAGGAAEAGMFEAGVGSGDAGASTGGPDASTGGCVKGQTKGSEVVVIGDSFIAINHAITTHVQSKARAAGALGQTDKYRDLSVSGTTLANNQIPGQYTRATSSGPVKVVLMNGGGNDCLQRNDSAGAFAAATTLLESMGKNNTEYVVYFFYPDPVGLFGGGDLQACLDTLRPQIEKLCDGLAKPKCFFLDLRSVWKPEYAMLDGIHPTQEGGAAVGDAVWKTMQDHCVAQ